MSNIILCADDSKTMQMVAEITFRVSDYEYVGALNAEEAFSKARESKPLLILADAIMPGKTGYDLCQMVKGEPALDGVPVVVLCGNSAPYDSSRGSEVGADGHLTKPWDTQVMLDKIAELVEKFSNGAAVKPSASPAAASPSPAPSPSAPAAASPTRTPASRKISAVPRPPPVETRAPAAAKPVVPAKSGPAVTPKPPILPKQPAPRVGTPPPLKPAAKSPPITPVPTPAPAPSSDAARTSTLMGMPSVLPPAMAKDILGPAGNTPGAAVVEVQAPEPAPTDTLKQPVMQAPSKYTAPTGKAVITRPGIPEGPRPAPAKGAPPAAAKPAAARPAAERDPLGLGPSGTTGIDRPPMIRGVATRRAAPSASRPAPGNARRPASPAHDTTPAAAPTPLRANVQAATTTAVADVARQAGLDPNGPEIKALMALSKDVVERVVWEVVPDLAEQIIRENLDQLTKR